MTATIIKLIKENNTIFCVAVPTHTIHVSMYYSQFNDELRYGEQSLLLRFSTRHKNYCMMSKLSQLNLY